MAYQFTTTPTSPNPMLLVNSTTWTKPKYLMKNTRTGQDTITRYCERLR